MTEDFKEGLGWLLAVLLFAAILALGMAELPRYTVWLNRVAAKGNAEAEVERAKGRAQANKIIGQSLNNNESYLRYLWINNLKNEHNQVIYIPTEANLPILEAARLRRTARAK